MSGGRRGRGWSPGGRRRLTVAASCTVSASAGRRPAPPAPPSGPECRPSLSGVRLAFPTHYSSDGGQRGGCSVQSSRTKEARNRIINSGSAAQADGFKRQEKTSGLQEKFGSAEAKRNRGNFRLDVDAFALMFPMT